MPPVEGPAGLRCRVRLVATTSADATHAVRVLDGEDVTLVKWKALPTVESLSEIETAALAGTQAGSRLEVVIEPTGPAWLPITRCFFESWASRVWGKHAESTDLRRYLSKRTKTRRTASTPTPLAYSVVPSHGRQAARAARCGGSPVGSSGPAPGRLERLPDRQAHAWCGRCFHGPRLKGIVGTPKRRGGVDECRVPGGWRRDVDCRCARTDFGPVPPDRSAAGAAYFLLSVPRSVRRTRRRPLARLGPRYAACRAVGGAHRVPARRALGVAQRDPARLGARLRHSRPPARRPPPRGRRRPRCCNAGRPCSSWCSTSATSPSRIASRSWSSTPWSEAMCAWALRSGSRRWWPPSRPRLSASSR